MRVPGFFDVCRIFFKITEYFYEKFTSNKRKGELTAAWSLADRLISALTGQGDRFETAKYCTKMSVRICACIRKRKFFKKVSHFLKRNRISIVLYIQRGINESSPLPVLYLGLCHVPPRTWWNMKVTCRQNISEHLHMLHTKQRMLLLKMHKL